MEGGGPTGPPPSYFRDGRPVAVGSCLGLLVGNRMPDRIRETLMKGLGLMVLGIGTVLLDISRPRVANLLPAPVFAPAIVALVA